MSNHLRNETSPYLLQHAENPVEWYPWGEEAFMKARDEDKPIFLSIGYSTCHWCHVMAHESFEDAETAALLNRGFVSIKVDREERPDIDNVYMAACQAMTGSGGWPLSVFLTPEKKPFYVGTYFPKTAQYGMPSFSNLLHAILEAWAHERENLIRSADTLTTVLATQQNRTFLSEKENPIERGLSALVNSFDRVNGGFGRAPKFPAPQNFLFLLQRYEKYGDAHALHMATFTLERMYAGGMFDHIGGGFCRYSTDRRFLVPHFEKMLYDNALLILTYAKAYELTDDRFYLDVAERTAAYLLREMRSNNGGFYSAQDADSEGQEGLYYVFTPEETVAVLGKEAGDAFNACFDITNEGNFEGKSIPNLLEHPREPERFEAEKQALLAYRKARAHLMTDDKALTFWNALAITAFCALYRVSGKDDYLNTALSTDAFLEVHAIRGENLFTSVKDGKTGSHAFLDDRAGLALAKLALYDATLDRTFLDAAAKQAEIAVKEFFDSDIGGFFFTGTGNETLLFRSKETADNALPSGNSIMSYVLLRLSVLAPDALSGGIMKKQFAYMKSQAALQPVAHTAFLTALSDQEQPPAKIVAVGAQDKETIPLLAPLGANVLLLEEQTAEYPLQNNRQTYYICRGVTCLPPTNELKKEWFMQH